MGSRHPIKTSLETAAYFVAGIAFLALAKAKNILQGYATPRPFDASDIDRSIDYAISVVGEWLEYLRRYTGEEEALAGKEVIELGPGSDLGTGICLLLEGCARYSACDVNDLMSSTPDAFYEKLLLRLAEGRDQAEIEAVREELAAMRSGRTSRLNHVVREDFDLAAAFGAASVDIVFSQAAFEHFNDAATTFSQLATVCRSGAVMVAEIDLKTHSRWIRDVDPNNIYRYPGIVYDRFRFQGIPNRLRPYQYRAMLEQAGWSDIEVIPIERLEKTGAARGGYYRPFADKKNEMDYLSIILCARKP